MPISSAELAAWVGSLTWPLARIGALLMAAPVLNGRALPRRVRALLALLLAVTAVPLLPPMPVLEPLSPPGVLITAQQVAIGLFMGFALRLTFAALEAAGQVLATQLGLAFASLVDPVNGGNLSLLSHLYNLLGMLVFLALDGHLHLIALTVESFRVLPVSAEGIPVAGLRELVDAGAGIFAGAVLVALPAIAGLMVVNLAFGVITRAAPQFNIFAVGFPITLLLGLLIVLYSLPALAPQLERLFDAGFALVERYVGGGG